jgi:hypothetical protein
MFETLTKFHEELPLCIIDMIFQNPSAVLLTEHTHQHTNVLVHLHLKNLVELVLEGTHIASSIATPLRKAHSDLISKRCSILIRANSGIPCHDNIVRQSKHHIFFAPEV